MKPVLSELPPTVRHNPGRGRPGKNPRREPGTTQQPDSYAEG